MFNKSDTKTILLAILMGVILAVVAALAFYYLLFRPVYASTGISTPDPLTTIIIELGLQDKTAWDWLELLIVPAFLAGGAAWIANSQQKRELREK